jgi:hypothetical protein
MDGRWAGACAISGAGQEYCLVLVLLLDCDDIELHLVGLRLAPGMLDFHIQRGVIKQLEGDGGTLGSLGC